MKKITALLITFIFLVQTTYAYNSVSCKTRYEEGSIGFKLKQKGILKVGEDSLIFIYKGHSHEIPYENIQHIRFSKKKKSLKLGPLAGLLPVPIYPRSIERYDHFSYSIAEIILMAALIGLAVIAAIVTNINKYVYLNITFDVEDKNHWAIFKIKRKDSQRILLTLSSKSGKEIEEIYED